MAVPHPSPSSSRSHPLFSHLHHTSFHHHHHHHNHHHHHPSLVLFWCLVFSLLSPLALSSSSSSSSSSSPSSASSSSSSSSRISLGTGETEGTKQDLHQLILRDEAVARLHELGKVSDAITHLERTFMSPASIRAINLIRGWMEDAGLSTWVDYMGNVHGRVEPKNGSSQALLIGSHMDTVIDAGKYDGSLGIISAISALKVLKVNGKLGELKRPVEMYNGRMIYIDIAKPGRRDFHGLPRTSGPPEKKPQVPKETTNDEVSDCWY